MHLLRWLNAGFLILAACRALVPGLCATQLAMQESADLRGAAAHALPACCAARPVEDDGRAAYRVAGKPHAECGLCALMHGMVDPIERASFPVPAVAKLQHHDYQVSVPALQPMRAHNGRAPPQALCVLA